MSFKDYFQKKSSKPKSLEGLSGSIESPHFLAQKADNLARFIPSVDFSDPSNFAFFGLAEKYYQDSFKRIYSTYPYDGSFFEKEQWHASSSYIDLFIFENKYPRGTGYVNFSPSGWGSLVGSQYQSKYGKPSTLEYISFFGGPNVKNVYDPTNKQESNLKISGIDGNTVEFWLKKSALVSNSLTTREVVFDAFTFNTGSGTTGYGRLKIELGAAGSTSPFYVTYLSGAASGNKGIDGVEIGASTLTTAEVCDNKWHHYAFTFAHNSTHNAVSASLFVDGVKNSTISAGSIASFGHITTTINGAIGSLAETNYLGYGKLSGSLDEFRFWKTARSPKQIGQNFFTNTGGGTNTSVDNTDLGVYYKFNEGITGTSSVDQSILDYSGRISNGTFTGYNIYSRNTGSAIEQSTIGTTEIRKEFKDPVLYPQHPDYISSLKTLTDRGKDHDQDNTSAIYHTIPMWMKREDQSQKSLLIDLTQIFASYFDTAFLQIKSLPLLKNKEYNDFFADTMSETGSKPVPFMYKALESTGFLTPEIFADSTVLERFANQDDFRQYEEKLEDIKNFIYRNIYNNLTHIYKAKGTEKSFRNLFRCFGIDDEIIRLNIYGKNSEFIIEDSPRYTAKREAFVDFDKIGNYDATIFQSATAGTQARNCITSSYETMPFTVEADIMLPEKFEVDSVYFSDPGFTESSIFGQREPASDDTNQWAVSVSGGSSKKITVGSGVGNINNFVGNTIAVNDGSTTRTVAIAFSSSPDTNIDSGVSGDAGTLATRIAAAINGTSGGAVNVTAAASGADVNLTHDSSGTITITLAQGGASSAPAGLLTVTDTSPSTIPGEFDVYVEKESSTSKNGKFVLKSQTGLFSEIESPIIVDLYDNKKWTLAVSVKPIDYPFTDAVSGSRDPSTYTVQFYGAHFIQDELLDSFSVSGNTTAANGKALIQQRKKFFVGAKRTNFTGSVVRNSDVLVSSLRYWQSLLSEEEINNHAIYSSYGQNKVYEQPYVFENSGSILDVPKFKTLSLHWDFNNTENKGVSDAAGQVSIGDYSSGSNSLTDEDYGYLGNIVNRNHPGKGVGFVPSADVIDYRYVNVANKNELEQVFSSNMIKIEDFDQRYYDRDHKPQELLFAIEKSVYDVISSEILHFFGTITDFNNLIGEPVNKYRQEYKSLEKLRDLFFARVKNTPSVEKFIEYYRWFDSAISVIIQNLKPATMNMVDDLRTMIESHILERNKYWHKFPTLEMKAQDPFPSIRGVNELLYDYEHGSPSFTEAFAKATISINSNNFDPVSDVVTIKSLDGTVRLYQAKVSTNTGNVPPQFGVITGGSPSTVNDIAEQLKLCIESANGHAGKFTVERDGAVLTLSQVVKGEVGNTGSYGAFTGNNLATAVTFTDFAGGVLADQSVHCLWWKDRADRRRAHLTTGDSKIDEAKETINRIRTTEVSGSTYATRQLSRPYRFAVERSKNLRTGNNTTANKLPDLYKSAINISGDSVKATATITTTGNPGNNETFTLTSATGNSVTFVFKTGVTTVDGTKDGDNVIVGVSGATGSAAAVGDRLRAAINNSDLGITATETSSGVMTLTQNAVGAAGNTSIDMSGVATTTATSFNGGRQNGIAIDKTGIQLTSSCNDKIIPNKKNRIFAKTDTENTSGYLDADADLILPFTLMSSSIDDPFLSTFVSKARITNQHIDSYGTTTEVPLQGPFAQEHVGGQPHRHGNLLKTDPTNRIEGYDLKVTSTRFELQHTSLESPNNILVTRDGMVKSPVNIKNIRTVTGSIIQGNYNNPYDYFNTAGRSINNQGFVQDTSSASTSLVFVNSLDRPKPNREVVKNVIAVRFSAPDVSVGDHRSSPDLDREYGEFAVGNSMNIKNALQRGALNLLSSEKSQKFGIRSGSAHTDVYTNSATLSASFHKINRNPKFTKSSRDAYSLPNSDTLRQNFDNLYVQRPIPQSDIQYTWITASSKDTTKTFPGYQHNFTVPFDATTSREQGAITFISSSDIGSYLEADGDRKFAIAHPDELSSAANYVPTDFVGINTNIFEPVSSSSNILGYPNFTVIDTQGDGFAIVEANYVNQDFVAPSGAVDGEETLGSGRLHSGGSTKYSGAPGVLNALIHHRGGSYGYPSWKQVRGGEHPVARVLRKSNLYSIDTRAVSADASLRGHFGIPNTKTLNTYMTREQSVLMGEKSNTPVVVHTADRVVNNYYEIPVTNRFKPINFAYFGDTLDSQLSEILEDTRTDQSQLELSWLYPNKGNSSILMGGQITYGNKISKFANRNITNILKIDETDKRELLDVFLDYTTVRGGPVPVPDSFYYSENIYPRENETYRLRSRSRTRYTYPFWKEKRDDRDSKYSITFLLDFDFAQSSNTDPVASNNATTKIQTTTPQGQTVQIKSVLSDQSGLTAVSGIGFSFFKSPENLKDRVLALSGAASSRSHMETYGGAGTPPADGTNNRFRSAEIDAAFETPCTLTYTFRGAASNNDNYVYDADGGSWPNPEAGKDLFVQYKVEGGSWVTLQQHVNTQNSDGSFPFRNVWHAGEDKLAEAIGKVRFRFISRTNKAGSVANYFKQDIWLIDNIKVESSNGSETNLTKQNSMSVANLSRTVKNEITFITASIWPLDARKDFTKLPTNLTHSFRQFSGSTTIGRGGQGSFGEGELQNDYNSWHLGLNREHYGSPASSLYARRWPQKTEIFDFNLNKSQLLTNPPLDMQFTDVPKSSYHWPYVKDKGKFGVFDFVLNQTRDSDMNTGDADFGTVGSFGYLGFFKMPTNAGDSTLISFGLPQMPHNGGAVGIDAEYQVSGSGSPITGSNRQHIVFHSKNQFIRPPSQRFFEEYVMSQSGSLATSSYSADYFPIAEAFKNTHASQGSFARTRLFNSVELYYRNGNLTASFMGEHKLVSTANVTDGNYHMIGLGHDPANRKLYLSVDNTVVESQYAVDDNSKRGATGSFGSYVPFNYDVDLEEASSHSQYWISYKTFANMIATSHAGAVVKAHAGGSNPAVGTSGNKILSLIGIGESFANAAAYSTAHGANALPSAYDGLTPGDIGIRWCEPVYDRVLSPVRTMSGSADVKHRRAVFYGSKFNISLDVIKGGSSNSFGLNVPETNEDFLIMVATSSLGGDGTGETTKAVDVTQTKSIDGLYPQVYNHFTGAENLGWKLVKKIQASAHSDNTMEHYSIDYTHLSSSVAINRNCIFRIVTVRNANDANDDTYDIDHWGFKNFKVTVLDTADNGSLGQTPGTEYFLYDGINYRDIPGSQESTGTADDGTIGTSAGQAFGISISVDGNTVIASDVGFSGSTSSGLASAGRAVVFRSAAASNPSFQSTFSPTTRVADELFAFRTALSGNIAVIGGVNQTSKGNVYVFQRTNESSDFVQQQILAPSDLTNNDLYGFGLAIDGDTIAVGAADQDTGTTNTGTVYVFTFRDGSWTLTQTINPSTTANSKVGFRGMISLKSNYLLLSAFADGSPSNSETSGVVYSYEANGDGTWTQQQILQPTAAQGANDDSFGISTSISEDGNTIAIGAARDDSGADTSDADVANAGAVYIFNKSTENAIARLTFSGVPSDTKTLTLTDLEGTSATFEMDEAANGVTGTNIVIDPSTVASTAAGTVSALTTAINNNAIKITAINEGTRLILKQDIRDDSGANAIKKIITSDFDNATIPLRFDNLGFWNFTQKIEASDAAAGDFFGANVALNKEGTKLAVSSPLDDDGSTTNSGAIYVFDLSLLADSDETGRRNWQQSQKLTAADLNSGELLGFFDLDFGPSNEIYALGFRSGLLQFKLGNAPGTLYDQEFETGNSFFNPNKSDAGPYQLTALGPNVVVGGAQGPFFEDFSEYTAKSRYSSNRWIMNQAADGSNGGPTFYAKMAEYAGNSDQFSYDGYRSGSVLAKADSAAGTYNYHARAETPTGFDENDKVLAFVSGAIARSALVDPPFPAGNVTLSDQANYARTAMLNKTFPTPCGISYRIQSVALFGHVRTINEYVRPKNYHFYSFSGSAVGTTPSDPADRDQNFAFKVNGYGNNDTNGQNHANMLQGVRVFATSSTTGYHAGERAVALCGFNLNHDATNFTPGTLSDSKHTSGFYRYIELPTTYTTPLQMSFKVADGCPSGLVNYSSSFSINTGDNERLYFQYSTAAGSYSNWSEIMHLDGRDLNSTTRGFHQMLAYLNNSSAGKSVADGTSVKLRFLSRKASSVGLSDASGQNASVWLLSNIGVFASGSFGANSDAQIMTLPNKKLYLQYSGSNTGGWQTLQEVQENRLNLRPTTFSNSSIQTMQDFHRGWFLSLVQPHANTWTQKRAQITGSIGNVYFRWVNALDNSPSVSGEGSGITDSWIMKDVFVTNPNNYVFSKPSLALTSDQSHTHGIATSSYVSFDETKNKNKDNFKFTNTTNLANGFLSIPNNVATYYRDAYEGQVAESMFFANCNFFTSTSDLAKIKDIFDKSISPWQMLDFYSSKITGSLFPQNIARSHSTPKLFTPNTAVRGSVISGYAAVGLTNREDFDGTNYINAHRIYNNYKGVSFKDIDSFDNPTSAQHVTELKAKMGEVSIGHFGLADSCRNPQLSTEATDNQTPSSISGSFKEFDRKFNELNENYDKTGINLFQTKNYHYHGDASDVKFANPSGIETLARFVHTTSSFYGKRKTNEWLSGESIWLAPSSSGLQPFYKDYDSYREEFRAIGKDYAIIPEYRSSERMNTYIGDNQINYFPQTVGDGRVDATFDFTLTGSTLEEGTSEFFNTHFMSDFMKYFDIVKSDQGAMAGADSLGGNITLRCSALLKLLPYEGFYPVNRTLQLANLYANEYIQSSTELDGLITKSNLATLSKQFFAPGILYNSIKSGVAVDYPIFFNRSQFAGGNELFDGNITNALLNQEAYGSAIKGSFLNKTEDTREFAMATFNNYKNFQGGNGSRISDTSVIRTPFEALINPYVLGNKSIYDNEPHPSASAVRAHITKTTSDGQVPFNKNNNATFQKYTLAMNNFVAETVNFFMEGGNLTSFKSRTGPFAVRAESINKKHKMRFYVENVGSTIYERESAFGPPVDNSLMCRENGGYFSKPGFKPFHPGFIRKNNSTAVEFEFTPVEAREYTLEEIVSDTKITYISDFEVNSNIEPNKTDRRQQNSFMLKRSFYENLSRETVIVPYLESSVEESFTNNTAESFKIKDAFFVRENTDTGERFLQKIGQSGFAADFQNFLLSTDSGTSFFDSSRDQDYRFVLPYQGGFESVEASNILADEGQEFLGFKCIDFTENFQGTTSFLEASRALAVALSSSISSNSDESGRNPSPVVRGISNKNANYLSFFCWINPSTANNTKVMNVFSFGNESDSFVFRLSGSAMQISGSNNKNLIISSDERMNLGDSSHTVLRNHWNLVGFTMAVSHTAASTEFAKKVTFDIHINGKSLSDCEVEVSDDPFYGYSVSAVDSETKQPIRLSNFKDPVCRIGGAVDPSDTNGFVGQLAEISMFDIPVKGRRVKKLYNRFDDYFKPEINVRKAFEKENLGSNVIFYHSSDDDVSTDFELKDVITPGLHLKNGFLSDGLPNRNKIVPNVDPAGKIFRSKLNNNYKNSMYLNSSFNLFGIEEVTSNETNQAESGIALSNSRTETRRAWTIQPKWELPVLDFTSTPAIFNEINVSGTISVITSSAEYAWKTNDLSKYYIETSRGLWHQYSTTNKGYKARLADAFIKDNERSLLDLCSFDRTPKEIGNVRNKKVISEAIVAVPFYRDRNGNYRGFRIPKQSLDAYFNGGSPQSEIKAQIDLMKKYVFPPKFDFHTFGYDTQENRSTVRGGSDLGVFPHKMYIFEFEAELDKQDLMNIWQNLPPKIALHGESPQDKVFSHTLRVGNLRALPNQIYWQVFKVKRRANHSYLDKINDSLYDTEAGNLFRRAQINNPQILTPSLDEKMGPSYNWPYDFFSLIELIRVDAKAELYLPPPEDTPSGGGNY